VSFPFIPASDFSFSPAGHQRYVLVVGSPSCLIVPLPPFFKPPVSDSLGVFVSAQRPPDKCAVRGTRLSRVEPAHPGNPRRRLSGCAFFFFWTADSSPRLQSFTVREKYPLASWRQRQPSFSSVYPNQARSDRLYSFVLSKAKEENAGYRRSHLVKAIEQCVLLRPGKKAVFFGN